MLKVVCVGYPVDSPDVVNISFDSYYTFLTADLLILNPLSIAGLWSRGNVHHDGIRYLQSREGSDSVNELMLRRQQEVQGLLRNGKVVLAFMSPFDSVRAEVRNKGEYHLIDNYGWLPSELSSVTTLITSGLGSDVRLKDPKTSIASYYGAFKTDLQYRAYLKDNRYPFEPLLVNKCEYTVGCSANVMRGKLLLVPYPPRGVDARQLAGVLLQCVKPHITGDSRTHEPSWVQAYNIPGASDISSQIEVLCCKIKTLRERLAELEASRQSLTEVRWLLYEQGKPLEDVVLRALRLMDFHAERFHAGDMEHDVVLEAPEGRALVEIEGRDNDAIHIDKLDQLSRVVDEDFNRRGTYANGVLVGNGYRLSPPDQRKDPFTDKVRIAAMRKGFGLLSTVELFSAVIMMLEKPEDEELKLRCRIALLGARGEEIRFPLD